jgi:hypothetical protein
MDFKEASAAASVSAAADTEAETEAEENIEAEAAEEAEETEAEAAVESERVETGEAETEETDDSDARGRIVKLKKRQINTTTSLKCFRTKSLSSQHILGILEKKFQHFDLLQREFEHLLNNFLL